ncbi:MAG TPA: GH92 family glycosyl hydrolase [Candidatus Acidoferrales bacterium]|jgi:predicted alpha-1,2-mannosidase|nr:GH92 family glycosyl hydrolase [Candidatus Acidoferrales bacterium]
MSRNIDLIILATFCLFLASCSNPKPQVSPNVSTYPIQNLLPFANPFCGTTHDGGLYPGATAPFGMIQWSPDSGKRPTLAGYNYRDSSIDGFSLDHLSGGGSWYGGNFAFMPIQADGLSAAPANRYAFNTSFSHDHEVAQPGYYSVRLDNGIRVELTATTRSGFGRFTYPSNTPAAMVINAGSNINGTTNSSIEIDPVSHSISGSATGGRFLGHPNFYTLYFYAVFNRPFSRYGTWSGVKLLKDQAQTSGKTSGAYVVFDTTDNQTVLARVGISYVSVSNAHANLESENPAPVFTSDDFDRAARAAGERWNAWLNKIQISGGAAADEKTFYSMLYHLLLAPTICSDANGEYRGYDGQVHSVPTGHAQYGYFSGWDIYRSDCQLLAMLAPDEASDMAESLLRDYQQGGAFPRWGLVVQDSGVMDGDPAAPIIAGFHAFGATNFDAHAALAGLVNAATNPAVMAPRTHIFERDGLADYLDLGYVPEDQHGIWNGYGNVSMTLEYATADFAVSQLAASLGDARDSAMLLQRAQNWRHLFNPQTGYFQMRRRDGTWAPGFTNNVLEYDGNRAYQEGTASQYIWMVPFNLNGLVTALGGPDAAAKRLDRFFTRLNDGDNSVYAYMGNEPCVETPWIYCFLEQPWKTQEVVRRVLRELYSSRPDGYPGNDDLGEMSSWYLWSALGMYPELPGSDVLVLGSPFFPETVLHLKQGDVTIKAEGAADDAPYVQSLNVNGQSWNKLWIRFSDVSHGGNLEYTLSPTPNLNWRSTISAAPPSYQQN